MHDDNLRVIFWGVLFGMSVTAPIPLMWIVAAVMDAADSVRQTLEAFGKGWLAVQVAGFGLIFVVSVAKEVLK